MKQIKICIYKNFGNTGLLLRFAIHNNETEEQYVDFILNRDESGYYKPHLSGCMNSQVSRELALYLNRWSKEIDEKNE